LPEITPIRDLELLETIKEGIKTANTLAELRTIYGDTEGSRPAVRTNSSNN